MARLIPARPPASAAPSVQRMFRLLKLLGDEFTIWHRTARRDGPQFLILWRDRYAFLLQVAATSQDLADSAIQPGLLPGTEAVTPETMGAEERQSLDDFVQDPLPPGLPIRRLVVFPNVDESTIDQVEVLRADNSGVSYLGLRQTSEERFANRLQSLAEQPLTPPALFSLRKRFHPESVVQESAARVPLLQRESESDVSPSFLDFDQESLAKADLDLPGDSQELAEAADVRLVTGPAGSGKSLVLIHRALLAARLHRGSRLLILTHNRPINAELRRRALDTAPDGSRLQWLTFFQWAQRHLPDRPNRILSSRQVEQRLADLLPHHPALESFTSRFLNEEFAYLRDLGITSCDEYLDLERTGRLTALTRDRRGAIWELLEDYRQDLARRGESDWHERALDFLQLARTQPGRIAPHDFIFIDEAQFFAKVWFAPVMRALAPGGQLFLAADPTQGFLRRRQSWLAAGLDVRGRAHRLSKPYRTTRPILEFATTLLERRLRAWPDVMLDGLDPPGADDLARLEERGEEPRVVHVSSPQAALTTAAREVRMIRERAPWLRGQVLLLHADSYAARELVATLRREVGAEEVRDLNDRHAGPEAGGEAFCSVSSLKAATGLEAAVVYLLGLDSLLEREADPRLDDEARRELASDHTLLLYMACTRAARRLVILAQSEALRTLLESGWERANLPPRESGGD